MYASMIEPMFVPKQARAILTAMEDKILSIGVDTQTAADANVINGARHRWVTEGTNGVIEVADFAKARYALKQANVPMTNLVAIVDPSVEYHLNTLANFTSLQYNPKWEGIVSTSIGTGMQFLVNIYGFDVYTSQHLKSGIAETIESTAASSGVANLFFSAAEDTFIGAMRQPPKVDSMYNMYKQRDEYVTTARYDFALYRPENLCVCITETDQVYA